jgi:hypothetical protein
VPKNFLGILYSTGIEEFFYEKVFFAFILLTLANFGFSQDFKLGDKIDTSMFTKASDGSMDAKESSKQ